MKRYWSRPAYNAADALLTKTDPAGTTYYSYDPDGNLSIMEQTGGAVTYFEHGSHGLITRIKPLGGTEVEFGYDALLRRVRMTEGAVTTYFRHDGINFLEITTSGGSVTKLTHGHTRIDGIGSVVEMEIDGDRYYFHLDHRGTLYKVTDDGGTVVWSGNCDAWGRVLSESGTNPGPFWYQGQAWFRIMVNGREYYISPTRIYDPETGSLQQKDLMAQYGTASVYHHHQNPMHTDPTGLWILVRSGLNRARVEAEQDGESYEDLARTVRLDMKRIRDWLKPYKANTDVKCRDRFTIPNTVVIAIGHMSWFAHLSLGNLPTWAMDYLSAWNTFNVIYDDYWAMPFTARDITLHREDMWGLVMFGHGAASWLGKLAPSHTASGYFVIDDNQILSAGNFGSKWFGLLVAKVCFAQQGGWGDTVSSNGESWIGSYFEFAPWTAGIENVIVNAYKGQK